jgi:DNA repair photolyase
MIISASRRTDIPAFYTEWLFRRIQKGFACVRNPHNPRQVSEIKLTPDVADGFVFWTKNPAPMLNRLQELRDYAYYFQFTLTPYGKDIEPNLPVKLKLMSTFRQLSDRIGPERIIWRYDPIIINKTWTPDVHLQVFETMAKILDGATHRVVISFVDMDYRNARRNAEKLSAEALTARERLSLAAKLQQVARWHGMEMNACAEDIDFSACGIRPARCIDGELMEQLIGCRLDVSKDRSQRIACGCAESVDIGMYNTCAHGCRYCYANYGAREIVANRLRHDPASPLLAGEIEPGDVVHERAMHSCKEMQMSLVGF